VIVYAESGFVLEVALLQEQHPACEELLHLAEMGRAELVVPAFAILEPYSTIFRRGAERKSILRTLEGPLRELARTTTLTERVVEVKPRLTVLLVKTEETSWAAGSLRAPGSPRWPSWCRWMRLR
jgi:hypothetical protein